MDFFYKLRRNTERIKYTKRNFLMLHIPQLTKWQPKPKTWDNYNCPFVWLTRVTANVILPMWYWNTSRENQPGKQQPLERRGVTRQAYKATKFFKLKTPLIVRDYLFCEPDKGFIKKWDRERERFLPQIQSSIMTYCLIPLARQELYKKCFLVSHSGRSQAPNTLPRPSLVNGSSH